MRHALGTIFLLLALSSNLHAAKPQIQWNEEYDFGAITTFQWQETAGSSLAERNPFMHSRILTAIEYELTASGLTKVESNPDVYVTYHTSTNEQLRLQSDSWGYGFGGYGRGAWGYYGYGRGGPVSTTTRVIQYDEGTLVVDIWAADTNELIWRGSVTDTVSDDIERAERQIVRAIEKMADRGRRLWEKANR